MHKETLPCFHHDHQAYFFSLSKGISKGFLRPNVVVVCQAAEEDVILPLKWKHEYHQNWSHIFTATLHVSSANSVLLLEKECFSFFSSFDAFTTCDTLQPHACILFVMCVLQRDGQWRGLWMNPVLRNAKMQYRRACTHKTLYSPGWQRLKAFFGQEVLTAAVKK